MNPSQPQGQTCKSGEDQYPGQAMHGFSKQYTPIASLWLREPYQTCKTFRSAINPPGQSTVKFPLLLIILLFRDRTKVEFLHAVEVSFGGMGSNIKVDADSDALLREVVLGDEDFRDLIPEFDRWRLGGHVPLKVVWSPGLILDGEHAIRTQQCPWSALIYQARLG